MGEQYNSAELIDICDRAVGLVEWSDLVGDDVGIQRALVLEKAHLAFGLEEFRGTLLFTLSRDSGRFNKFVKELNGNSDLRDKTGAIREVFQSAFDEERKDDRDDETLPVDAPSILRRSVDLRFVEVGEGEFTLCRHRNISGFSVDEPVEKAEQLE